MIAYLAEEAWEAEQGTIVEGRVVEGEGQDPREAVGTGPGERLPAELQAAARAVQTAHGQRELKQVQLVLGTVPAPLQSDTQIGPSTILGSEGEDGLGDHCTCTSKSPRLGEEVQGQPSVVPEAK